MNEALNRITPFLDPLDLSSTATPVPSAGAVPHTPAAPPRPRSAASPLHATKDAAPALPPEEQARLQKIAQAEQKLAVAGRVLADLEWQRPLTLTAAEAEPLAESLAHLVTGIIEDLAEAAAEALEPPAEPEPLPADPAQRQREEDRERQYAAYEAAELRELQELIAGLGTAVGHYQQPAYLTVLLTGGKQVTEVQRRRLTAVLTQWRGTIRLWVWAEWALHRRAMGSRAGLLGNAGTLAALR